MTVHTKAHPLAIQYAETAFPCAKAWTLIKTTKKSTVTDSEPYVVTTETMADGAEDADAGYTFTMKILCNKNNWAAFLLTPKHGKLVYALAILTSVTPTEIYADTVEQVTVEEAATFTRALDVEITLAEHLVRTEMEQRPRPATEQIAHPWTLKNTPLRGKPCRELGRSPTDAECPPTKTRGQESS